MAENVTPVVLEIDGFAQREVMMVDYKFDQATDREGQRTDRRYPPWRQSNHPRKGLERRQQRADRLDARPDKPEECIGEIREHR